MFDLNQQLAGTLCQAGPDMHSSFKTNKLFVNILGRSCQWLETDMHACVVGRGPSVVVQSQGCSI